MARLVGIDLPSNKKIIIALTYIQGIGLFNAKKILEKSDISFTLKTKDLTEHQIVLLRNELQNYVLEGDLKRKVGQNIRRLMEINCYKGNRHKRKLPVRGQRTHTNARTKRGKKVAVAGKKKVTK
tara:strand:- start:27 stop:401 length:375 start_codon:yes stop_codon:yes gene_type:complete